MKKISVSIIPQLKDNYSYILHSENNSTAVIIDPAQAEFHFDFLNKNNLTLDTILLTHHHHDHTSGVTTLLNKFPLVKILSPNVSIDTTTNLIKDKDFIKTSLNIFNVIATPGHTLDHIILYDEKNSLLFCGDTLFRLGCGRIFEGTHQQMYNSLQKINNLPDNTSVYCGHEYTLNNLFFLESFFDDKSLFKTIHTEIEKKIDENSCTIPFNLGSEKKINPFLNQKSDIFTTIKKNNNLTNFEMFKLIREKKDNFS